MVLQLPAPDPQHTALLDELHEQHDQIRKALAAAEIKAAALIVHGVWGADAAGLLLDMRLSDEGDRAADASLLLVLDRDSEVLWFNPHARYDTYDHPATSEIEVDDHGNPLPLVDEEVVSEIAGHLEWAYEAGEGVSGSLYPGQDDHFKDDINLVFLDVHEALG